MITSCGMVVPAPPVLTAASVGLPASEVMAVSRACINTLNDSCTTGKQPVKKRTACRIMLACASKAFCTLMRASTSGNCALPCRNWHQQSTPSCILFVLPMFPSTGQRQLTCSKGGSDWKRCAMRCELNAFPVSMYCTRTPAAALAAAASRHTCAEWLPERSGNNVHLMQTLHRTLRSASKTVVKHETTPGSCQLPTRPPIPPSAPAGSHHPAARPD